MKQLLSLFLFLLPCLAWAQYPSNGNQKITLGEQTTADGLIWRGVLADTGIITPSSDTSAYIILDTVNHRFYNYNRATNVWSVAGGGTAVTTFSAGSTGLTPNTATSGAVTLGGTLAVANGGTNTSTAFTAGSVVFSGSGGTYTQDNSNLYWDNTNKSLGIGTNTITSSYKLFLKNGGFILSDNNVNHGMTGLAPTDAFFTALKGTTLYGGAFFRGLNDSTTFAALGFEGINYNGSTTIPSVNFRGAKKLSTSYAALSSSEMVMRFENLDNSLMVFLGNGNVGIGVDAPSQKLHVVGNARITAMNGIGDIGADANGVLQAAISDMNLKNTIENSPFGLNEILLLNPVTFLYNDTNRKIDSDVKEVGFIAQDVFDIIPNAVSSTGTGDLQLDYRAITATLTKAIQEQNALIKALEQRIINLENK
jgi:hypothetical protein